MKSAFLFVTFNEPKIWVKEAIESMLSQTVIPFEIVQIDNSPQGNYNFSNEFEFGRINYIYIKPEKKLSFTQALNLGIKTSKSEIIFRADPDDICCTERIGTTLNLFRKKPQSTLIASRAFIINEAKDILGTTRKYENITINLLLKGNPIVHGTIAFKREKILLLGGYNNRFERTQDYELYTHLLLNGEQILFLNKTLYYLRIHRSSVSSKYSTNSDQARNSLLIKKYIQDNLLNTKVKQERISRSEIVVLSQNDFANKLRRKSYRNYIFALAVNSNPLGILKSLNIRYFLIWIRGIIISLNPKVLYKFFFN